ncbi:MAG TPA: MoxR family ATPase [Oligoflexia bacterium]|nr:MoxR family ATPase [Oligoflexia bacterium]HMP49028.1 MoxR family ATPase [Oligoflexia bacterium]
MESTLIEQDLERASELLSRIRTEVNRHVLGQEHLKKRLLTALISGGHILLEGVPGLAKTLSIRALAKTVAGSFNRIQFTPDLLPSDITGSEIYRPEEGRFVIRKGPVFANFILADEINRAPAKVQSALLETMQEGQVSIGDQSLKVPKPFFVLATQNPIEQEGTYTLPEAQIDRFMMKLVVGYPSAEDEAKILELITSGNTEPDSITPQISLDELRYIQDVASRVYVDERIRRYIVNLVTASRELNSILSEGDSSRDTKSGKKTSDKRIIELGASPRASISLFLASRAEAVLSGSRFVTPQMIKDLAHDILRHRLILSYEADLERLTADSLIDELLAKVPVP